MIKNSDFFVWGLFLSLLILLVPYVIASIPQGVDPEEGNSTRPPIQDPQSVEAQAGNVTELNINGFATTKTWQGYFGNVSGTIRLADASSNIMYNWTQANPRGQVYATTNDTILWENIQCFNLTASGTFGAEPPQEPGVGKVNLNGLNYTQLHDMFNIPAYAADGVNNTFISEDHDVFYTASLQFNSICPTAKLFTSVPGEVFQNVLLYEPISRSVIFTALLEVQKLGFDNRSHDFQMIVLDDGREVDIDTTTYYFFVEIE
ncbi:hypothetical protein K0A97_03470 [Patescibacteria group bacterium]|nr:hypothetical protein [Patescibacteria group bacterium]